ncbi:TfoX/Sxy family protein [Clostridium sp. MT-14]|uniref:TfoX/Sxy family protein n=1 Tax=Clostridium aromativorans TaxID=2836848 RepID=A0ABS8N9B4_9CLOT|nr:TfoX/Sxy family protein [Clostridium aromativorans]MCC9296236.1 TfoX/Sxy family protein [Clostridium aromativorans]
MNTLHELPNISKVIEKKLIEAGVDTPQSLMNIGSKEALSRIRLEDDTTCINMLYALKGAIKGIRWHSLSNDIKQELKEFYKTL